MRVSETLLLWRAVPVTTAHLRWARERDAAPTELRAPYRLVGDESFDSLRIGVKKRTEVL
ncbi:MAG: hypothetical protein N2379_04930 [Verrucomicrobiae bacterium]|nr:hypothetical protein [Verrucomicrobiae bacterium]